MKYYQILYYNLEIIEKEFLRETDQYLFYYDDFWQKEKRVLKKTSYDQWFRSKEKAIQSYRKSLEDKIIKQQLRLQNAKDELQKFNEKYPQ